MIVYYLSFVSRTKTDDPEREKLKAKAKDIQREDDVFFKETMTEGFTMVDFDITRTISIADEEELIVAVFGSNLLDERARNHTSFVKNEVPLAGRNFGVKLSFNF